MKYNPSDATCDKSKNIRNMTWDLFIIRHFFKKWETKKEDEEFLFASDDNAFGKILLIAIHVYKESSFDSCKNHGYINSSDLTKLNALFKQAKNIENRVYQTPNFTCEDRINHRDSLISQLEIELGIFFSHSHAPHGNAAG